MEKAQKAKKDLNQRREDAAQAFYKAGIKYIAALDEWIEAQESSPAPDNGLKTARQRVRMMETYLHRLFPDEFADTSSAAE
jgi:hypothetical protein